MKSFSISAMAVAIATIAAVILSSCSFYDFDPESSKRVTDIPIDLEVLLDIKGVELPEEAFTPSSPLRVIGLRQECQSYSKIFDEEAYIDDSGHLVFMHKTHYWLNDRCMTFTAFWPADSEVTTDNFGRIVRGNCIVQGHTVPLNPTFPREDGSVSYAPLIIRKFLSPQ